MSRPAMFLGLNFVRRHTGLDGQTPAQAAGVEQDRWTLETGGEMTEQANEDAKFEAAFARLSEKP